MNGEKTVYVWDDNEIVMELSDSGRVQKRYVRGNDRGYGSNLVYADKGDGTEKKDDNPFRYCGEYFDKETDSIYLRARCYQPELGRFLTRDTYTGEEDAPLSLHLYAYCWNDGVNRIDPSGNIVDTIVDVASIGYRSGSCSGNTWFIHRKSRQK